MDLKIAVYSSVTWQPLAELFTFPLYLHFRSPASVEKRRKWGCTFNGRAKNLEFVIVPTSERGREGGTRAGNCCELKNALRERYLAELFITYNESFALSRSTFLLFPEKSSREGNTCISVYTCVYACVRRGKKLTRKAC